MPTIRQRLTDALLGEEKERLREATNVLLNAYASGPWDLPPDELVRQLSEVDPWTLQDILWQYDWELIGGVYANVSLERERAIKDSVRLYRSSPLAQWCVWLWTGWGIGDKVRIEPTDAGARQSWQEFWQASRNAGVLADDEVHELSNWLLVKGNRFLAFFASTVDGQTTVRLLPTSQIAEIVSNPDDASEAWFYKRTWQASGESRTLYYPDWQLFFSDKLEDAWNKLVATRAVPGGAQRADRKDREQTIGGDEPGTAVCVLHLAFNHKEDPAEADSESAWGWPLLTTSRAWTKAHKHYMEARLTVAEAKAMYVRRKKVQGGSRAVSSVINTIASKLSSTNYVETNPPAAPGSTEVENAAVETSDLPMTTGAGDAKNDNEMFTWMALLGAGVFPTSAGLDTARWATALEMDKAQSMTFERYQIYWSASWRKVVKIVLGFQEKYAGAGYQTMEAEVSIDAFSLSDFPKVAESIGGLVRDGLAPLVDNGVLPSEAARAIMATLWRVNLQALGVDEAGDLTSDEAFGIGLEPGGEAVEAMARVILENAEAGGVDWEAVGRWALDTLREGYNGLDKG